MPSLDSKHHHDPCPYVLKSMALNKPERIANRIKQCHVSVEQWKNKIQATISQGHHRSASFYETKLSAVYEEIAELEGQEKERQEQEEAREDLIQRRRALETHAFDMTVLRRKREALRRAALEQSNERSSHPFRDHAFGFTPTNLGVFSLVTPLRKVNERRGMSGGMFEDEEVEIQQEMEALERWLEMRIEFENSATRECQECMRGDTKRNGEVAENGTTMLLSSGVCNHLNLRLKLLTGRIQ